MLGLHSGTGINHIKLTKACNFISKVIVTPRLLDAIIHLDFSYYLVKDMVGSIYETKDRKEISKYELDRIYFENRNRYDHSFLSAFRGIELLMGKPSFKKYEVTNLLKSLDDEFGTSFTTTRYKSSHEIFSSHRRWWRYEEIIIKYLDLRNAVAAHGNQNTPKIIMEDQVFEIQFLLKIMFLHILNLDNY